MDNSKDSKNSEVQAEQPKTAKQYNELRELTAVANTRAAKELKVSTKVKAAVNHETVASVCKLTGIAIELIIPKIPGHVFEYTNPLSIYANVKGIIAQGTEYMTSLDAQVLAGIWLTAYRHYDLVAKQSSLSADAVALNAMLRTAGKKILVDSLDLMLHIHSNNCYKLPRFSIDYNAHKEFNSLGPALQEYNRAIRNVIYPGAESKYAKSKEAVELADIEATKYRDDASYVSKVAEAKAKTKLSSAEREYEEQFILNRREAKQILARLTEARTIPALFIMKLKPVFVGKNLVAMAPATRASVSAKLRSYGVVDADRLAEIVEQGHNPYDIFADIDDAFATNEANLGSSTVAKKRSLKEILEAKAAGTYVAEPKQAVEQAVVEEVKLSYTAEDELRHQELEEAMDEGQIISDADAKWNNAYLKAKEAQEALDDANDLGDSDGTDF